MTRIQQKHKHDVMTIEFVMISTSCHVRALLTFVELKVII